MDEVLRNLPRGAVVLDLGCAAGSFKAEEGAFRVVRVDLDRPPVPVRNLAQADAARLPFPPHCFDAVVSNHSLEHFEDLEGALREIGRVVKPGGALYIAVPDCTTLCDRLYRWLGRGGGHVNGFASASELAALVESATGLRHVATRVLCTSLSFLNRKNRRAPAPKRLLLLGGGAEWSLRVASRMMRFSDRFLKTRLTVYGWALYFGAVGEVDRRCWTNVCVRCGSGHPSERLVASGFVRRWSYRCPDCGAVNGFSDDRHFPQLNRL